MKASPLVVVFGALAALGGMAHADDECSDALIDPVATPLARGGLDAQRGACPRSLVMVGTGGSALIDTPGFHGEIDGVVSIGLRRRVGDHVELGLSVGQRYVFVQNAVNTASEWQTEPFVLTAAWAWTPSFALVGAAEVPGSRGTDTIHVAGSLTAIASLPVGDRTHLHARLGMVGDRAWSLAGTTGRLAFRAGTDVVRRLGDRWALDLGADVQAGWFDGFDAVVARAGVQRRFGRVVRGVFGAGAPLGGGDRRNVVVMLGVALDVTLWRRGFSAAF